MRDQPILEFSGEHSYLSNFHRAPVGLGGLTYQSGEAAFQAQKTTDMAARRIIAAVHNPGEAKRMGRAVLLRHDWETVKVGVMMSVLRNKFKNEEFARRLIATGDAILVEGNTWNDTEWGACWRPTPNTPHIPWAVNGDKTLTGKNLLGNLLMQVRRELTKGAR